MVSSGAPLRSCSRRASSAVAGRAPMRCWAIRRCTPLARISAYSPRSASSCSPNAAMSAGSQLRMIASGSSAADRTRTSRTTSSPVRTLSWVATCSGAGAGPRLSTMVDGRCPARCRSSYRLDSSTDRLTWPCTTCVPTPRLRTSRPLPTSSWIARRMVGRDSLNRSASCTSLSSRYPGASSPVRIACSSCWATWKYSGTGLDRSRSTVRAVVITFGRYADAADFVKTYRQSIDISLPLQQSRSDQPPFLPIGPHAMRIGLAGVGRIGAFHADILRQLAEVDSLVVADADRARAQQVAEKLGVSAVEDAEALLRAGLDGLVIAAATDAHAPLILAAVDAGLPVFCEKPVANDLAGTLAVVERVAGSDVPVQIGFQRRFDAGYNAAGYDVRLELLGSAESISVGLDDRLPLRSAEPGVSFPAGPAYPNFMERFRSAYARELAVFAEVVAGQAAYPCSVADALAAFRVAEACEASRRERRPVRVEEVAR